MILTILVAIFLVVLISLLLSDTTPEKHLPPGPYPLPLLGHLHLLDSKAPYISLTRLVERWGRVFSLRLGSLNTLVIADGKTMKDIFSREEASGRAPLYLTHGIMKGLGIICSEGSAWAEQRLWLGNTLRELLKGRDAGEECARMIVDDLAQTCGDQMTDLEPLLSHNIGNYMNKLIFGFEYKKNSRTWAWLQELRAEGVKLIGVCGAVNFLPWLRFLPSIARNIRWIKEGQVKTHLEYERIVKEREGKVKLGEPAECLTDFFLQEMKNRKSSGQALASFTREQLYYLQADIFGAGTDTTLTTILWNLLFIGSSTSLQKKIKDDIEQELTQGENGEKSISVLKAIIYEVARLRPVTPLGVPHGTLSTMKVGDWIIPKGTMVIPLHWAINRDPDVWDQPNQFRLERFLEDPHAAKRIFPFQSGRRHCIGSELGKNIVEKVLAAIITNFTIEIEDGFDPWHPPNHGFTLTPEPFKLRFRTRKGTHQRNK